MSGAVAEQIRRLFTSGSVSGLGEGALIDRFVARGDEAAFEAIVARHGPLVLGVCRRFLRDPNDIDDAFQATFLVLTRKAGSLRRREALGPWLHGVAYRVAVRARARSRAERLPNVEFVEGRDDPPGAALERDEAAEALHEELAGLPEVYRAPVVLCHLEGLTHDEAAARLCWPVGTVRGRLARGRDRLRDRLSRRGFGPASLVLVRPSAAVPEPLAAAAGRLARQVVATGSFRALAPSPALSLAQGVVQTMSWSYWKTPVTLVALIATLGTGVALSAGQKPGTEPKPEQDQGRPVEARPPSPAKDARTRPTRPPRPTAEEPALEDPVPPSLPKVTLPVLGEEDTSAKIQAAQAAYDRDLETLAKERTNRRADLEVLEAELVAIKERLGKNLTNRLDYLNRDSPVEPNDPDYQRLVQRTLTGLERERTVLTEKLREAVREIESRRAEFEVSERALESLRRRPRPTERVEVRIGDHIVVEVLEALQGRPIAGERFVRADGKISLSFYGEIYVAGLTTSEIKEKVILRLRKILPDEILGLIVVDMETGKPRTVAPKESDRVFVDIVEPKTMEQRTMP